MLGGVGDRQAGLLRQGLHAAFGLTQLLQQFEAMRVSQGFRDQGELREQGLLWTAA
jgi:hypothetical protein